MNTENLPSVLLAYVGDAVFEVYVRTKLVQQHVIPIQDMHRKATKYVRASGQDTLLRRVEPFLSEREAAVVRRGRNTKSRVPKNSEVSSYRRATGFEALLGWLYLTNQQDRLQELLLKMKIGEEDNE